jgi:hypothetical protein
MGIRYLNRFLANNCSQQSIRKKSLAEFRNTVLVIDASIYLYRFLESNMLIEGFYNMVSIFRKYNISPVFVFDGKPPIEKKELLEKRRSEKDSAEKAYNDLKTQLHTLNSPVETNADILDKPDVHERKMEIMNELDSLKKRFVRIKPGDIMQVKDLLNAYGAVYIESAGEADQLCAYLVRNGYANACVSDDMDMFLYGCPRVIRHISLVNHTGILYDTESILKELNISYETFRDIMILAGTDYNIQRSCNLYDTMNLYYVYSSIQNTENVHLYDWLVTHAGYNINIADTRKIRSMFDLNLYGETNKEEIQRALSISFCNREPNKPWLNDILRKDGFIFLNK